MNPDAVASSRAREVPVLYAFAVEVGAAQTGAQSLDDKQRMLLAVQPAQWPAITRVGQAYVDGECQSFIAALNDLERTRRRTLADLNALESASVGIMGLARTAQQTIGYVGISFGLVASLFDNTVSSFLYQLPASGVASVINAQRDILMSSNDEVLQAIHDEAGASARLTQYVQYCTPVTIEANIGKVLGNTQAEGNTLITLPAPAALTRPGAHGTEFRDTASQRLSVSQRVERLHGPQLLALANLMLPHLGSREPDTQSRVDPFIIPPGGPFTDRGRASTFVTLWSQIENMTDARRAEWSSAISQVR